jgi:FG-GAP-like repeat/ASPIC and UnbV
MNGSNCKMRTLESVGAGLQRLICLLALFSSVGLASGAAKDTNVAYSAASTRRMAERLQELLRASNPMSNQFLNSLRVEIMEKQLPAVLSLPPTPENLTRRFQVQSKYAIELLNAGKTDKAIDQFEQVEKFLLDNGGYEPQLKNWLRPYLATAYLRLGEQENCLAHHSSDSCLLPIRGDGVHTEQRGSRGAIRILTQQLTDFPKDLRAAWLLNIAYMTVGEYPDKVPPAWLIPPKVFDSDYPMKRFRDIAPSLDLDVDSLAGGVIVDDFDGDGNLDLVMSSMGVDDQIQFFRNNGDGTFTERTRESGLVGELGGLNIVSADYNNDGHLDFLILRGGWMGKEGHYPNSLLRNNGNGTFDDVTEQAGMLSFHPTQTATWFDFNNDGWLDVFIANETAGGDAPQYCELYRNNGNGTFTDIAAECGFTFTGMLKAVVSGDYNNDGRPDLYISWRGHDNLLLRNDGPKNPAQGAKSAWKFTEVAKEAGVTQPFYSFPSWFFDYDNDGWLDLFVSGYGINNVGDIAADYLGLATKAERVRLYRNNRDGTFADVTKAARVYKVIHTMGCNFGDLDNDGWLDFYLGTGDPDLSTLDPGRMFRNADGKFFQDVTTSGGFGHLQKGHGVAFGDLDNDGDQDIYHVIGGAYEGDNYRHVLWENPGHGAHWITLKLEGVQSNRAAIGARIKVTVNTASGERSIYQTVSSGGSFGCSPLRAQIGLGQAQSIRAIEVTWPATGKVQVFKDLAMDQFYKIREGDAQATPWKLKSFKLAGSTGDHDHLKQGNSR